MAIKKRATKRYTKDIELCEVAKQFLITKKKSTANVYKNRLERFLEYYKKPIKTFIQEIEKEQELNKHRSITERKRIAETIIRGYVEWMKEQGLSSHTINAYITTIQSLLAYYGIQFSTRWIELPPNHNMNKNKKHKWKLDEIKQFVDCCEYIRDKTIVICLFQSGLAISDLLALNVAHVRKQLEKNDLPIMIDIIRKKTNINFKTFFGADSAKYLKMYLKTRPQVRDSYPLFTMLGSHERATPGAIQFTFRRYAEKIGIFSELDLEGWNPARPHSFRSAFRSRLTNKMDRDLIEFMMGHSIGEVQQAYLFPMMNLRNSTLTLSMS